jgi:cytochrome b561
MADVTRYHPLLVLIHWVLAFLIIGALFFGATKLASMPNEDPEKLFALRFHMTAGVAILSLMLLRLFTRNATRRPPKASTGNASLDKLAHLSHYGLYILVIAMGVMGLTLAFQAQLFGILAGAHIELPPSLWVYWPRAAHYIISRLLMFFIALHICGALYHTFIVRDGLLRRMAFGRKIRPATSSETGAEELRRETLAGQ